MAMGTGIERGWKVARIRFIARASADPEAPDGQVYRKAPLGPAGSVLHFEADTDFAFDQGGYLDHAFSAVEIRAARTPAADVTGAIELACRLVERGRGPHRITKGGVYLITACQIAGSDQESFLRQFAAASRYMGVQPGFVRFHLYQSLSANAEFRFVNIAQWRSSADFIAAFQRESFKKLIRGGFDQTSQVIVAKLRTQEETLGAHHDLSH